MNESLCQDLLDLLDEERCRSGNPSKEEDVVREISPDGDECTIAYSHSTEHQIDAVISREVSEARLRRYRLEWKAYSHDKPGTLRDRLAAAGFEPAPAEQVLYLPISQSALSRFDNQAIEIRKVRRPEELEAVAQISRDIGRKHVESEQRRLAAMLERSPRAMSIYVAYWEGDPVACGRVYFPEQSEFAELAGGRTKTAFRQRGYYTALIGARMREALQRRRRYLRVDALPTSEPILMKRGFQYLTSTQPFVFDSTAAA